MKGENKRESKKDSENNIKKFEKNLPYISSKPTILCTCTVVRRIETELPNLFLSLTQEEDSLP